MIYMLTDIKQDEKGKVSMENLWKTKRPKRGHFNHMTQFPWLQGVQTKNTDIIT
jgi:hypothetical protein